MNDKEWNDKKIEHLLKDVPDIHDSRSKSEILARLNQDKRLKSTPHSHSKKWLPVMATVAALLILSILIPSMMRGNDNAKMDAASEVSIIQDDNADRSAMSTEEASIEANDGMDVMAFDLKGIVPESHIVLQDELHGASTFRIALTESATIIPATFLIPGDRIAQDFPKEEPDNVALYNKYAAIIPEMDLGFDDYHPYRGEVTAQKQTIIHQVPDEHSYDMSSATIYVYMNSMRETFKGYSMFKTVNENDNPAVFDQVGTTKPVGLKRHLPYYKYVMPSGEFYLIPYEADHTVTVTEALKAMKEAQNDIVKPLVPETIQYDVRESGEIAIITFTKRLNLLTMDPSEATAMIEGFMLTAGNYNKRIRLENIAQDNFGKYDLTSALPKPVGVNPIPFPE
ncbi:hypothetical protein FITA111629_01005 [Filibacter tadaridae]|uniref:Sigma-X negative effector n=1 Tax=Filibacter tadaridae TaxID=2483811 RepID=A0A3P5XGL9_9BACL|nr:hypothetical protein [Filibacter tadaridae]VDC29311.1 Sigma-X negative effector [Filibacter tadaridae]